MKCLVLIMSFSASCAFGMYDYQRAQEADLPELLTLINTQAIHDGRKIVILPEKFRALALSHAIDKKRLFVAKSSGKIIGYKKLFLITDEGEKKDILCNEIRCCGRNAQRTYSGFIDDGNRFLPSDIPAHEDLGTTYLYNGADFTHSDHRKRGINSQLTTMALLSLVPEIKEHMHKNHSTLVCMLYGLTEENAGLEPGKSPDRTLGITPSFKILLNALERQSDPIVLQHARYRAFMPTFDPKSEILAPLSDDQSVPGYGCILSCALKQSSAL